VATDIETGQKVVLDRGELAGAMRASMSVPGVFAPYRLNGKLLVGPGSHCIAPPGYDLGGEVRRYFDHHLKGRDTGLYAEPRVTWHLDGAPAGRDWIRSAKLPGQGVPRSRYVLAAGGVLSPRGKGRDERQFAVDFGVASAEYFSFWIDSQAAHGLKWTAPPLEADQTLVGSPVIQLRVAADRTDANVFAYLEELSPAGDATVISFVDRSFASVLRGAVAAGAFGALF